MGDSYTTDIKSLVKQLTTSGKEELDSELFKKLKNICKKNDMYVTMLYEILFIQFKKKHAEIRLSCFEICDQIFRRSHCFRCLILDNFSQLLNLVLCSSSKESQLRPVAVAKKLKVNAIKAIKEWYGKYGNSYIKLALAIDYMINCKNVDFVNMTNMTIEERLHVQEQNRVFENMKVTKVNKIKHEIEEISPQVESDIVAFKNCFKLLIPAVEEFFIPISDEVLEKNIVNLNENSTLCSSGKNYDNEFHNSSISIDMSESSSEVTLSHSAENKAQLNDSSDIYGSEYVRALGILKGTSVKINLSDLKKVHETTDNQLVVENLKELYNVLTNKWLGKLKHLHQVLLKYCDENADLIKKLVNMKCSIELATVPYSSITIVPMTKSITHNLDIVSHVDKSVENSSDSDDDSDFIEVTDSDPRVVSAMQSEAQLLGLLNSSTSGKSNWCSEQGAGSSRSTDANRKTHISTTNYKDKYNGTFSVPTSNGTCVCITPESFVDKLLPPTMHVNPLAGLSQVWLSSSVSEMDDDHSPARCGLFGVATTAIVVNTPCQEVLWQCRAPLPSGRLCPRRDRRVCPLHGAVLPRTNTGRPDVTYAEAVLLWAQGQATTAVGPLLKEAEGETTVEFAEGDVNSPAQTVNVKAGSATQETLNGVTEEVVSLKEKSINEGEEGGWIKEKCDGMLSNDSKEGEERESNGSESLIKLSHSHKMSRKELCSLLNKSSGAFVNSPSLPKACLSESSTEISKCASSGRDLISDYISCMNSSGDNTTVAMVKSSPFFFVPSPKASALPIHFTSPPHNPFHDDSSTSNVVSSAHRLLDAVRAAEQVDRRKRMRLDVDWQEPALLAEIKAATGVELDMRTVRRRRGARSNGLTDLRSLDQSPRRRLAKKVLGRAARRTPW